MNHPPKRIVCLSAEAADWLWRIGAWEQVAGISAFFTPPPGAAPKPKVSGFSTANLPQIVQLNPDLIITFSDVQAALATELIRLGFTVLATNQRTLEEVADTLALLARAVNRDAQKMLDEFRDRLAPVERTSRSPRIYFEEWDDPLIYGIGWVGELIERAGGHDIFAGNPSRPAAQDRVVSPQQVLSANPEMIVASWCGKPVNPSKIAARPGWSEIAAVRGGRIHELPGEDILQPGFRLVHGYERLKKLIQAH